MDKFDGAARIYKKTPNILEKPLNKGRNEVHISSFALLFSEIVQYSQNRVTTVADLQTKLSDMGKSIGSRMLDVLVLREKGYKRETRIINVLLFIKTTVWKSLFGKEADKLEQSNDDDKTSKLLSFQKHKTPNHNDYQRYVLTLRLLRLYLRMKALTPKLNIEYLYCPALVTQDGWLRPRSSSYHNDYIIEKEPLVNKFISRQKDKGGLNCAYFIAGVVEEILFGCNFHCKVTAHWHKGTTFMIQFEESVIARDKAFDAR